MKHMDIVARRAVPIGTGVYEVDFGLRVKHDPNYTDDAGGKPEPRIISMGVIKVHIEHRDGDEEGMKDRAQALAFEQFAQRLHKALWMDED